MVRRATMQDLDEILAVVNIAKEYMKANGNGTQWGGSYPGSEDFAKDLAKEQLYVCYEEEHIYGVFVLAMERDPNYEVIENGQWLNDEPYGTLHRIAGDGTVKGVFQEALAFAKERCKHLRIDTHEENGTMRHLIVRNGFQQCGTVFMQDGSPRIAYQLIT